MNNQTTQLSLRIENQPLRPEPTILLSIKPGPYEDIKQERKKYEYKKKFINQPVHAFLYMSSPVKSLSGYAKLGQPIIDSVETISRIAENEVKGWGIGVKRYLRGLDQGVAIPIKAFTEIEPIHLDDLRRKFPWFSAPQLYVRLENKPDLLDFLLHRIQRGD